MDPRAKLAATAAGVLGLLLLRQLGPIALSGAAVLLLYASAGLAAQRWGRIVRSMAPISLLMAGLRAVFYPVGAALAEWGPIQLTASGLADGAAVGLRLLVMGLVVFLWLYTTEGRAIVDGLVRLGLPYAWGLSLSLALRYIPTVGRDFQIISQSQQARGLDLQSKRGIARVRAMLPGLMALILTTFRASENMARALEARAFGAPGVRRTTLEELRFRPLDWLTLAVSLLGLGALLYLRIRFGFGAAPP